MPNGANVSGAAGEFFGCPPRIQTGMNYTKFDFGWPPDPAWTANRIRKFSSQTPNGEAQVDTCNKQAPDLRRTSCPFSRPPRRRGCHILCNTSSNFLLEGVNRQNLATTNRYEQSERNHSDELPAHSAACRLHYSSAWKTLVALERNYAGNRPSLLAHFTAQGTGERSSSFRTQQPGENFRLKP
jgi:hypothetical protein